jgi:hypothetical protein
MNAKALVGIVRDSKHAGTVTRQQIDRAIRLVEAGKFVRKNGSTESFTHSKQDSETRAKH